MDPYYFISNVEIIDFNYIFSISSIKLYVVIIRDIIILMMQLITHDRLFTKKKKKKRVPKNIRVSEVQIHTCNTKHGECNVHGAYTQSTNLYPGHGKVHYHFGIFKLVSGSTKTLTCHNRYKPCFCLMYCVFPVSVAFAIACTCLF